MDDRTWIRRLFIVLILARFGTYVVQSDSTNDEFRAYLKHFNKNRHHVENPDGKTHVRDFIRKTFNSFGLQTWKESFVPRPPNTEIAKGENIIGFLPGKFARTRDDRLILIGSHYDTMRSTSQGADDNGSGVVALLRVARLLTSKWDKCSREYSVMFVAFDFEESEEISIPGCACAELGCGSRAFVSNFSQYYNLFPNMSIARYGQLQGAIIMDTMMNYNSTPCSQDVPPELEESFPEQYKSIIGNENRGDFLLATGRYSDDDQLLNAFSYNYKKGIPKYKLQVFPLPFDGQPRKLSIKKKEEMRPFLRSDHVSFWNEMTSNRAIFLSDTANMRSYMRTCYHQDCDTLSHVTNDFLGFLSKSCDTIVMTTDDLTEAKCKSISSTEETSDLNVGGSMTIGMLLGAVASFLGGFCCWWCRKKKSNDELVANQEPNWTSTNPVFAGQESEGTGNRGTGNRGTGNTGIGNTGTQIPGTGSTGTGNRRTGITDTRIPGTGSTGTGNTGTRNTGTGNTGIGHKGIVNQVQIPNKDLEPNVYEEVCPGLREPGKSGTSVTRGPGSRERREDVHQSIA